ncbi:Hypothetical protein (plasmid) [Pseudomonas putida]|nr:Hypothetical protein [Pseudomonas putida]
MRAFTFNPARARTGQNKGMNRKRKQKGRIDETQQGRGLERLNVD